MPQHDSGPQGRPNILGDSVDVPPSDNLGIVGIREVRQRIETGEERALTCAIQVRRRTDRNVYGVRTGMCTSVQLEL
eukprot:SAG22_NODE_430_length_10586_cov_6.817202_2_plen_77_part_00